MPSVSKQRAKTKRKTNTKKKTGGILDRAIPVSELDKTGLKCCLYGRGKTGKTTLACTFKKPLLLIGTEDGTKSVSKTKGIDFFRLEHTSQIDEIAEEVQDKYRSIVMDTAGGLQDMIMKEILGLDDSPVEKSWGMAGRDQWQSCGVQTKERLRALLNLADTQSIDIVIIAHERNFNDEGGSDLIFPTVGAALTPSTAGWLNGACDYLCQTFLREQTISKDISVAGKKKTKMNQRTGKVEHCLRIGGHPVYMTGFRRPYDPNRDPLPSSIVNPTYEKLLTFM
jgi:hypothetical protein